MSDELSEADLTNLRWMRSVNPDGVGLYGPTVRKNGALPDCERLVRLGLAKRLDDGLPRKGYWITDNGLAALVGESHDPR